MGNQTFPSARIRIHRLAPGLVLKRVVLVMPTQAGDQVRGMGESTSESVSEEMQLRALHWLDLANGDRLRIRITSIDRYAGRRCICHFNVISPKALANSSIPLHPI